MIEKTEQISIDLAVYMERLDTYISTQSQLNEALCNRLENLDSELEAELLVYDSMLSSTSKKTVCMSCLDQDDKLWKKYYKE